MRRCEHKERAAAAIVYLTSLESKVKASGARFGPLQNGCPVDVVASLGKLKSNCLMALLNLSSN